MPRSRKRDASAVSVTVRPNTDGGSSKKTKSVNTKSRYSSSKKYYNNPTKNGSTRTVELVGCYRTTKALTRNTVASIITPANDIFSVQPMGRDQMFAMYQKAYVKSTEQEAFVNVPTYGVNNGLTTFIVNHWVDNQSATSADLQTSNERCLSKDGKHVVKTRHVLADGNDVGLVEDVIHTKVEGTTMGITHRGFNEPDCSQGPTAGPTLLWYFHLEIYAVTDSGTVTYANVPYETVTRFNCIFWDPVELATS